MQESNEKTYTMIWYEVDAGDLGCFKITVNQYKKLLLAEHTKKARIAFNDDEEINLHYIRKVTKQVRNRTSLEDAMAPLSEQDKKFIVKEKTNDRLENSKTRVLEGSVSKS